MRTHRFSSVLIAALLGACSDVDSPSEREPASPDLDDSMATRRVVAAAGRLSAAQQVEHAQLLEQWLREKEDAR